MYTHIFFNALKTNFLCQLSRGHGLKWSVFNITRNIIDTSVLFIQSVHIILNAECFTLKHYICVKRALAYVNVNKDMLKIHVSASPRHISSR